MRNNFGKFCKKCSINLIGRDSGGLRLKIKFRLGDIRGTGEYTGCNKKIEPAKYLEKYTFDRNVKKYEFNVFKELSVDVKSHDVPVLLGGVDGGQL